ncbi:hypothetical protein P691DRAFT_806293 [Macrolepiota fuliginosa MF-IS2]|uniref:Uncharacterized protein n=1 Tax=Macrolepiota fuliginosa MF-IS2 TaxID=1400762 RepID=A0A9P5XLT3_9AGAR|nr:hypothetical protein P691DRAFT_806293 [Macrolepiota fuliginosa MF-IS2]
MNFRNSSRASASRTPRARHLLGSSHWNSIPTEEHTKRRFISSTTLSSLGLDKNFNSELIIVMVDTLFGYVRVGFDEKATAPPIPNFMLLFSPVKSMKISLLPIGIRSTPFCVAFNSHLIYRPPFRGATRSYARSREYGIPTVLSLQHTSSPVSIPQGSSSTNKDSLQDLSACG